MIPHFLVIGTHKSGTTWLDRNLRMHPEIWLPPEKEIHYFNLPKNLPFTLFLFSSRKDFRLWVRNRFKRAYRGARADSKKLDWYLRYCLLPRTDSWYSTLFSPDAGQVAGDVTPHYAVMSDRDIARVNTLASNMKMIYLLRNPIDRMWSHAAMHFSKKYNHQGIGAMDEGAILEFLLKPSQLAHARSFENLSRWENHFPKDQIFVSYFDEIANAPSRLLAEIFQFLGVSDSDEYISERSTEKIYGGDYPEIPRNIASQLAEALVEDMEKLHQHLISPYTEKWLSHCHSLLESPIEP